MFDQLLMQCDQPPSSTTLSYDSRSMLLIAGACSDCECNRTLRCKRPASQNTSHHIQRVQGPCGPAAPWKLLAQLFAAISPVPSLQCAIVKKKQSIRKWYKPLIASRNGDVYWPDPLVHPEVLLSVDCMLLTFAACHFRHNTNVRRCTLLPEAAYTAAQLPA